MVVLFSGNLCYVSVPLSLATSVPLDPAGSTGGQFREWNLAYSIHPNGIKVFSVSLPSAAKEPKCRLRLRLKNPARKLQMFSGGSKWYLQQGRTCFAVFLLLLVPLLTSYAARFSVLGYEWKVYFTEFLQNSHEPRACEWRRLRAAMFALNTIPGIACSLRLPLAPVTYNSKNIPLVKLSLLTSVVSKGLPLADFWFLLFSDKRNIKQLNSNRVIC